MQPAPAAVQRMRDAIASADVVLIATPEYNGSVPGVLKNAIDWASRPFPDNSLRDRPAAVIGASPSIFGAVWAQAEVRKVLKATGARVLDDELPVAKAAEAFDTAGRLRDPELGAAAARHRGRPGGRDWFRGACRMTEWMLEPGHTEAGFRARHMMVTWVQGLFKDIHGRLRFRLGRLPRRHLHGRDRRHQALDRRARARRAPAQRRLLRRRQSPEDHLLRAASWNAPERPPSRRRPTSRSAG